MTTRKILVIVFALMMSVCAAVPDDDSVPYYPYPPQPQPQESQTPKTPPKKTPAKKPAPKKKTPPKKPAPKKSSRTSKRTPAVRQTPLQHGIELLQQDKYEQAKPYLLKAIQQNRNDPNVWYWYGVYHEKTGGFYQAQYFYSKAVTIDPAFEPLSRVVFYPEDKDKTPLWDPKRPARVYPVETASVPLNVSRFPNAPNDPEMPKVPVYTPPAPNSSPLDGDEWSPSVYVPPSPEETEMFDGQSPVYTPPDAGAVVANENVTVRQVEPRRNDDYDSGMIITERDKVLRADKPLYNPPEPGQKVAQAAQPQKTEQPQKAVKVQQKQEPSRRQASVPANRIVRQQKKSSQSNAPAKTQAKPAKAQQRQSRRSKPQTSGRTVSQDVRPQPKPQTQRQQQPSAPQPPQPPVRQPQPEPQPQRRQTEYMPPVGQYAPDPGTISETPIPPVGHGNNN